MKSLLICTHSDTNFVSLIEKDKIIATKTWEVEKHFHKDVLLQIDKLLNTANVTIKNIKNIGVYQGPGSYTSIRVGITIANALGFACNIPVIGIIGKEYNEKISTLTMAKKFNSRISQRCDKGFTKPVEPYYETIIN